MTDLSTAIGMPVKEIVNGKEITLYPLRARELSLLEQSMKDSIIRQARDSIKGAGLSENEQRVVMSEAMTKAMSIAITSQETIASMTSLESLESVIFISLQRGDKTLTRDKIGDMLSSMEDFSRIAARIFEISGFTGPENGEKKAVTGEVAIRP